MAAKRTDISLNTVLIIGGIILAWPLIAGLFSFAQTAGGILSFPGRLANALNKEFDENIKDLVFSALTDMAKKTIYDPADPRHAAIMRELKEMNDARADYIIKEWKKEGKGFNRLFAAMTLNTAMKKVNDYLNKWF